MNNTARALIIVDMQQDFLPGGALAVPDGDRIITKINNIMDNRYSVVVATKDYHPPNHKSFASQHEGKRPLEVVQPGTIPQKIKEGSSLKGTGQLWPDHCVQGTWGSKLAENLKINKINKVIFKGMNPEIDSYSGFFENDGKTVTELHSYLQKHGITTLHIVGLATDYCVKYTALDAVKLGYNVVVLFNCCKGMDTRGTEQALTEMKRAGITIKSS